MKIHHITENIYLLENHAGKLKPYLRMEGKSHGFPVRGFNKKGRMVWRTYKTIEEAKANLLDADGNPRKETK